MHGGAAHLTAPFSLGNPGQSPPAHQALGCPNPRSEPCKEGIRHVVTVYQGGSDNLTGYRDRRTRLDAGLLPAAVTWVGLRNDSQHSRVGIERSAGTKAVNLAQFHATCSGRVTDSDADGGTWEGLRKTWAKFKLCKGLPTSPTLSVSHPALQELTRQLLSGEMRILPGEPSRALLALPGAPGFLCFAGWNSCKTDLIMLLTDRKPPVLFMGESYQFKERRYKTKSFCLA